MKLDYYKLIVEDEWYKFIYSPHHYIIRQVQTWNLTLDKMLSPAPALSVGDKNSVTLPVAASYRILLTWLLNGDTKIANKIHAEYK